MRLSVILLSILLMPGLASASDKLRGDVFCFPAKDVPRLVDNLKEIKQDRRDIVEIGPSGSFCAPSLPRSKFRLKSRLG